MYRPPADPTGVERALGVDGTVEATAGEVSGGMSEEVSGEVLVASLADAMAGELEETTEAGSEAGAGGVLEEEVAMEEVVAVEMVDVEAVMGVDEKAVVETVVAETEAVETLVKPARATKEENDLLMTDCQVAEVTAAALEVEARAGWAEDWEASSGACVEVTWEVASEEVASEVQAAG